MFHLLKEYIWKIIAPFINLLGIIKRRLNVLRHARKFPGLSSVPIIGDVYWNLEPTGEGIFNHTALLSEKFGDVFRVHAGPKLLVTCSNQQDCELLLSKHDFLEKGFLYSFLKQWLGDGLLLSSGEKWHRRRKILTPAFHFKILEQFVPVLNSCGDEFIRQLRKSAGGAAIDVWPVVKLLTLDVICETTMGVKMNAQTNSNSEYVNAVTEMSNVLYEYGSKPWIYPQFIFKRTQIGQRYFKCLEILHNTTNKVIRQRREELNKLEAWSTMDIDEIGRRRRVAFLDLLLLVARDGSLSDEDIRAEVDTFMFEGHDTTASAISFTLYLLSQHENIQDKIFQELETVFDPCKPLQPTLQQVSELKYLEMVIKEALRLYPPVSAISRNITKDMPLASRPLTVPNTAEMFLSIMLLQRNPEAFPDPGSFNPDRFTPDECARRHPFAYVPFSAGPRNCIGQRFAMLEMKCLLAKVIWNYRLLPDPTYTPILTWEIILKSKNGIYAKFENRHGPYSQ